MAVRIDPPPYVASHIMPLVMQDWLRRFYLQVLGVAGTGFPWTVIDFTLSKLRDIADVTWPNSNLIWLTDNTYDIGASGANRPRDLYLGRNLAVGGSASVGTTLTVAGVKVGVVNKTANYTATATDHIILVNATSGSVTITLPAATTTGLVLKVKKIDSSANSVIISRAGADTIEGSTSLTMTTQYAWSEITADGTSTWYKFMTVS